MFKDRREAGKKLAQILAGKFQGEEIVVYGLPRGGVVTADEITRTLKAKLDLIIVKKIGHPLSPEYAIGAVAEDGHEVLNEEEASQVDPFWLEEEVKKLQKEARRRRETYPVKKNGETAQGKIAILVDDGIATGLTMRASILEIKHQKPKKIIVATPIVFEDTAGIIQSQVDELVALYTARSGESLGAIGAYYQEFPQVSDEEVIKILKRYIDPIIFSFDCFKKFELIIIKQAPQIIPGEFSVTEFANREIEINLKSDAADKICYILGTITPPHGNLMRLLLLAHTLKKERAKKIVAFLPYLAYMRQDKKMKNKSLGTQMIGQLFAAAGIGRVITIDVHSPMAKYLFPVPFVSLSPACIFASEINNLGLKNITLVAPDEGAIKRVKAVAKEADINNTAFFEKRRNMEKVTHLKLHGDVGSNAVIIDDMLDTGSTLVSACRKLQEKEKRKIIIMVTHGLFTGNLWQQLWNLGVEKIYTTDTVPRPVSVTDERIITLPICETRG